MEITCAQKKKDYYICEIFFHRNLMVTTHKNTRTKAHNIKQERTEEKNKMPGEFGLGVTMTNTEDSSLLPRKGAGWRTYTFSDGGDSSKLPHLLCYAF